MGTRGALGAPRRVPPSRGSEREEFKRSLCANAAEGGHLDVPHWARAQGCPCRPSPSPFPRRTAEQGARGARTTSGVLPGAGPSGRAHLRRDFCWRRSIAGRA